MLGVFTERRRHLNGTRGHDAPETIKAQAGDIMSHLGLRRRASDENRTRTISPGIARLGSSCTLTCLTDQPQVIVTVTNPWFTASNDPLMRFLTEADPVTAVAAHHSERLTGGNPARPTPFDGSTQAPFTPAATR